MFAAVDVFYDEQYNRGRAACIVFADSFSDAATEQAVALASPVPDYEPGEFNRRELPSMRGPGE